MKIIGHRGAAKLALENTLDAFKAGVAAGVDGLECDVRLTRDGYFVVHHDENLLRLASYPSRVDELSLNEIKTIKLHNGDHILQLEDVLKLAQETTLFIEAKGSGWANALVRFLKPYIGIQEVNVIAFNHTELAKFHKQMPDIPVAVIERWHPMLAIRRAIRYGFNGVVFRYNILNPITYWWACRNNLFVVVYVIDSPVLIKLLRLLYPKLYLETNKPTK